MLLLVSSEQKAGNVIRRIQFLSKVHVSHSQDG